MFRGTTGIFRPKHPEKYLGNTQNIVWRSTWERSFMRTCDESASILQWSSEEIAIPYFSPVDGRNHRYFPDFIITVRTAAGPRRQMVEIKPKVQTLPPVPRSRKTKRFLMEMSTYMVNDAKWAAARAFCATRGWDFIVLTEEHLFPKKRTGKHGNR